VDRALAPKTPAVFWLDKPERAHDRNLIEKVKGVLDDLTTAAFEYAGSCLRKMRVGYTLQRTKMERDTSL